MARDALPLPLSSATWTPAFFAAALIAGIALSPNGDWGARASAFRIWSASGSGKCRSDRGTVRPLLSFDPPGSMYANTLSGRSFTDEAVIVARLTFASASSFFISAIAATAFACVSALTRLPLPSWPWAKFRRMPHASRCASPSGVPPSIRSLRMC